ncbi:hypothetical protein BD779DRAFT_1670981 [Infundibulicybe gibba]|nr:hypothetical protein BD779DRAFT_1670981 [Infundibulicybe gibba]
MAHRKAWMDLTWSKTHTIAMFDEEELLALDGAWEFIGGVLGLGIGPRMRFIQVPSTLRDIPMKEWVIQDLGYNLKDFGMDPSQDLLIVIEEYNIQVFKNKVAITLQSEDTENEVIVWNWMSGEIIRIITGEIRACAFLTEQLLMVGTVLDHSPYAALDIVDLTQDPEPTLASEAKCCSFLFPPLNTDQEFSILTDYTSSSPSNKPQPFTTSQEDRLLVIAIYYGDASRMVIFVPLSTFLGKITGSNSSEPSETFTWEDWGLHGSRIVTNVSLSQIWFCYVHGMKVVAPSVNGVHIFDFNQRGLMRDISRCNLKIGEDYLMGSNICPDEDEYFDHPVESSLPCRVQSFSPPNGRPQDAFMLGEDSIVMIPSDREFIVLEF